MRRDSNPSVDLALWPIKKSTPDSWTAVGTAYPEVARGLLGVVGELERLRAELASARAQHEQQLTAIAAAARALCNATPSAGGESRHEHAIERILESVLTANGERDPDFARARDRILELGQHMIDLWRGARCGAEAICELECAAALQRGWLPGERPRVVGGVEIAGCCRAAESCSGDWWTASPLADGRVLVVVVDAMGSGARAALLIALLKGAHDVAVQYARQGAFTLPGLLSAFNRTVYRAAGGRVTATCSAAIIDAAGGTLTFAGAGHPLPVCARRCPMIGQDVRCLPARGAVLGESPTQRYRESTIALRTGDAVVWCTDGILDCEGPRGRRFGARRLCQAIAEAPSLAPGRLRAAVRSRLAQFAGASASADDMALVVAGIP